MQKRGKKGTINEQLLLLIIDFVVIFIVWFALFHYVRSVERDTLFDKIYLSKDIALLTNTVYSSPGNLFYTYSSNKLNLSFFDFSFEDNLVTIEEHPKGNELSFPYATDLSFESKLPYMETPEKIEFAKTNNKVSVKDSLTYNLNQLSCPDIKIREKMEEQVIVIDPGHGDDPEDLPPEETPRHEPGLEFDNKKESSITVEIGWDRIALLNDFISTRDDERYVSLQERKNSAEDANIIISIHIGNYSNNHNSVKAFIPYKTNKYLESKKLACKILNAFLSEFELDGVVIVSVDTSILPEEDPMQILNFEDKVAVLLEIGNINTEQGRNMFNEISKISTSITQGLTNYYSK